MDTMNIEGIIGNSPKMQACISKLRDAVEHTKPVLISGEIGTGKKLFSKKIHEMSRLHDGPFRLFDAFTQPRNPFIDIFESNISSVDGGTLVFHNIDTLLKCFQERLASHFSNQQFDSHFGKTEVPFRMIATTTESLQKKVSEGTFFESLYDFISDFQIHLPPLKERLTDIEDIVNYHLKKICLYKFSEQKECTLGFISALEKYNWPHNIKELIEVLEVSVRNSKNKSKLEVNHLPLNIYRPKIEPILFPDNLESALKDSKETMAENRSMRSVDSSAKQSEKLGSPQPENISSMPDNLTISKSKRNDVVPTLLFYKEGDYWKIGEHGKEKSYKNLIGFKAIHYLLRHPNEHFTPSFIHDYLNDNFSADTQIGTDDTVTRSTINARSIEMSDLSHKNISQKDIGKAINELESNIEEIEHSSNGNPEERSIIKDILEKQLKILKEKDPNKESKQRDSSPEENARTGKQKLIRRASSRIFGEASYMRAYLEKPYIVTGDSLSYNPLPDMKPNWILWKKLP